MAGENISYIVAFTAGIFTYLSPCLLPLIPSFIAYLTGISFGELKDAKKKNEIRYRTMIHSSLFILGFSVIFILLGLAATFLGKLLFQYQNAIRITGGILVTLFGLYLLGAIKLDFLAKERKLGIVTKRASYIGSFLIGVTFAAAWTPCAGPILGSILVLAGTKASVIEGAKLLTAYSLGIALPFFATALAVNIFLEFFNRFKKIIGVVNKVAGILLVMVGILLVGDYYSILAQKLSAIFGE